MAMRKLYSTILLLAICMGLFSQGIAVRFSGRLNGTQYCQLDSVVVTNLSRDWVETVEYPDTTLMLELSTGFSAKNVENQGLLQNVPNPFDGETRVELSVSHCEDVNMQLLDITGKVFAQYDGKLDEGTHAFDVTATKPQTYILNAIVGDKSYSIKMVNIGCGSANDIKYSGFSGNITAKLTSTNYFQSGDNMRYVGYATIDGAAVASVVVVRQQTESQDLTLNFYYPGQGTLNGHEWVNLGLPSGTCWATCNVGATYPEGYGNYYAWGEVTAKTIYDWNYYRYCNGSATTFTKYCDNSTYGSNGFTDNLTVLEAGDDVATANWGDGWRMPTQEEMQELLENCYRTFTDNGLLLMGRNGNTIFLPYAGHRYETQLYQAGDEGGYWTSTLGDYPPYAASFNFSPSSLYIYDIYRFYGMSVRAVCNPQE